MNSWLFAATTLAGVIALADALRQRAENAILRRRVNHLRDRAERLEDSRWACQGEAMAKDAEDITGRESL
jgi:hypothetical protein